MTAPQRAASPAPPRRQAVTQRPARLVLQRRCACGSTASGDECESCATQKLFRRATSAAPRGTLHAPSIVGAVLSQAGRPLPPATRAQMESRFGHDFSAVRVHADAEAARSARAVHAEAYTVGSRIVFGTGRWQPGSAAGQRLLAHELAHVMQQHGAPRTAGPLEIAAADGAAEHEADRLAEAALRADASPGVAPGGSSAGSAGGSAADFAKAPRSQAATAARPDAPASPARGVPPSATRLQRRVSPQWSRLEDDLTYGLRDWAVTDDDAHDVLAILGALNPTDLADTVARLQREGLLSRLFSNVSDSDQRNFRDLLQRIAGQQVWAEKQGGRDAQRRGSCNPGQLATIATARGGAIDRLTKAFDRLGALRRSPNDAAQRPTADVMRQRFRSVEPRVVAYVQGIVENIRHDLRIWGTFEQRCLGDWDTTCAVSGAYVQGNESRVTFCSNFFKAGNAFRIGTMVHELAHVQPGVAWITDRAYQSDRAIRVISTEEALTNAESYDLVVEQLATGKASIDAPSDDHQDCPKAWTDALDEATARAQRSNRDAQVTLRGATPDRVGRWSAARRGWLGGTDDKNIEAARDAYDKAANEFKSGIDFECEPGGGGRCDDAGFYWYAAGDLHVCPSWMRQPPARREPLLLSAFYGFIGAGKASEQDGFARLAVDLGRHADVPSRADILAGSARWTPDALSIEVEALVPNAGTSRYIESAGTHSRLSQDLSVYGGADCAHDPLPLRQRLTFWVDSSNIGRPVPFLPPDLHAEYSFRSSPAASFVRRFDDPRPRYSDAGTALRNRLPDPIVLRLDDDGTLHTRIAMRDLSSGVDRLFEDDLPVRVHDPCPNAARPGADSRPPVQPQDRAAANGLRAGLAEMRQRIDQLLAAPAPPQGEPWAVDSNPNVRQVVNLIGELQSRLDTDRLVLRFDQAATGSALAHYDVLDDTMHLRPPAGADRNKLIVDMVHEYAHARQDRVIEVAVMLHQDPRVFNREVDLQQEIEARSRETYFTRLAQLAGYAIGGNASQQFAIEVTARRFVSQFEAERTGNAAQRRTATASLRKELGGTYAQQFKDNGSFADYALEIAQDGRARLFTGAKTSVDLGAVPDTVADRAALRVELTHKIESSPALAGLFRGPKGQAYDRAVFTVYFRRRVLLQFGIFKPAATTPARGTRRP